MGQHARSAGRRRYLWPVAGAGLLAAIIAGGLIWQHQSDDPFVPSAEDPGDGAYVEGIGPVEREVVPYVPEDATVTQVQPGERVEDNPVLLPEGTSTVRVGEGEWAVVATGDEPDDELVADAEDYLAATVESAGDPREDPKAASTVAIALEAEAADFAAAFNTHVLIVYGPHAGQYTAWSALIAADGTLQESRAHESADPDEAIGVVSDWLGEQGVSDDEWVLLDSAAAQ